MEWQGWLTLALTGLVLLAMVRNWAPADALFLGEVVILALFGVIEPNDAVSGFANAGMLMVGAMFVVAAALRETGVLSYVGHHLLGRVQTAQGAMGRLAAAVGPLSAVLNNTPIVAMFLPVVIDWCRKRQVSPSRLLIPLSYLTVLGGMCTLIGTSTNLVVHGLMLREKDIKDIMEGMGFFEIGYVGIPLAIVGTGYMLLVGTHLLPDRKELIEQLGEARREYLVEMLVQPGCRLVGQSVEAAGLRQLPGLFLIEIDRDGTIVAPVGPEEVIHAQDRLIFTGIVSTIVDLEKIPGLVPAADEMYTISARQRRGRQLCEAVVSPTSPLVGKNIRSANFRAMYNAAVVAVHRNGARMTNKVGDVVLHPGDTLLLQVGAHFSVAHRNNPDFYLVSVVEDSRPLRHDRAVFAVVVFVALIVTLGTEWVHYMLASFLAAGLMVAGRCISAATARQSVDWQVLITIAAAFGVGTALEKSGAAAAIAQALVSSTQDWGHVATLAALYLATMLLNEIISNNAAAALMFPLCIQTAALLNVSPRPFIMGIAVAASAAFASPIGYQTHMMVYGPGGYRYSDFVRVGLPLNLILWVMAVVLIPFAWSW